MSDRVAWDGCALHCEDRAFLNGLDELPVAFRTFSRPEEIRIDWHRHENQGRLGSCQGNALTSCLERVQFVRHRKAEKVVQLSRIFGYLATQKLDGLLGQDSGSTISNGGRLAIETGCPPERMTGYPSRYPGQRDIERFLSRENYEAAGDFKAESLWKVARDPEENFSAIAGGTSILFGIKWYPGIMPRDRIIRQFRPPRRGYGGHALFLGGYTRNSLFEGANSHNDGPFWITPEAWLGMLADDWTAAVGIVGTAGAEPVDWFSDSPYFK